MKRDMDDHKLPVLSAREQAAQEDGFTIGHFQGEMSVSIRIKPGDGIDAYIRHGSGDYRSDDINVGAEVCNGGPFIFALHAMDDDCDRLARMLVAIGERMLKPKDVDNLNRDSD